MSFILDALRKSEAARRRSEAPDLFAAMPQPPEPGPARRAWPLWVVSGIGVLSLMLAVWLVSQRPSMPASTADTARIDDTQRTTTAPPIASEKTLAASTPADAAPGADSIATTVEPAMPPAVSTVPVGTPTAPLKTPVPAAPASTAAAAATPPSPATAEPREVLAPPTAVAPAVAPTTTPAFSTPADDRPVSLADLDPATRKQLPALKLSMHVWNETSSGRFVILDGQRLKEGDVLGELVVERITREGAVLAWRGGRLKVVLQ